MAVSTFTLPDLGEGLQEAEIVEWHVSEGDRIVADQPLVSVETDKAVVEVPSPLSGTVSALYAQQGDVLPVGAALAEIDDGKRADPGAIVGDIAREASPPAAPTEAPPPRDRAQSDPGVKAAPAVRALARNLGVALAGVAGSGPGGAITRADVEHAAQGSPQSGPSAARRSMARAMARSGAAVVPATLMDVANVTSWHAPGADVMVRLIRAICRAAHAVPALATWYDPEQAFGSAPGSLALGIAVDAPHGLYVPVIGDVATLSPDALRARLDDLIARVRDRRPQAAGRLTPSITLSNFGPLRGRHAALVVTPPQVAILGAGRVYDGVAWHDSGPARAALLPLSLTFDHRAATGGDAARFLAAAIADLETENASWEAP